MLKFCKQHFCPVSFETRLQKLSSLWSSLSDSFFHDWWSYMFNRSQIWTDLTHSLRVYMQNESWHCLQRHHLDGSICLCTTPVYVFTHIPVTQAVCSAALINHDRRLLLLLSLKKVWMVPLVFGTFPFFPETSWNVDSSEHSTHFHYCVDYLRWALAHRCTELMYIFLLELNRYSSCFSWCSSRLW